MTSINHDEIMAQCWELVSQKYVISTDEWGGSICIFPPLEIKLKHVVHAVSERFELSGINWEYWYVWGIGGGSGMRKGAVEDMLRDMTLFKVMHASTP